MAFVFELDVENGPRQDDLGTWVIDIGLGYDIDEDLAVVMSVMLVPGDMYGGSGSYSRIYDVQFGIRRKWPDKVSEPDFDKATGRKYIPREKNWDVLKAIMYAIERLVRIAEPAYLTMETYQPNLEPRALQKYHTICARLSDIGYEVADAFREPSNGVNYWYLRRR